MKKEESLDFEIGFADSKIERYIIDTNNLTVFLECWNAEMLEIKFLGFVALNAMNYFMVADIREVFESVLLEKVLNEFYETKPTIHPYRIFKILGSDDEVALEIVCEDVVIKKLRS